VNPTYTDNPKSIGRRGFLQSWSAAVAAVPLTSAAMAQQAPTAGNVLYESEFVPEGAESRVAFVTDHHYWPNHLENWGGGSQITSSSDRRMPDLAEVLNRERPDFSVHAGDVISAGGSFYPTPEEYAKQLAFEKSLFSKLKHPSMALVGNHETLDPHYDSDRKLDDWVKNFGAPYRHHDVKGWRLVGLNSMLANPNQQYGPGDNYGNVYGLGAKQMGWLRGQLQEAKSRGLKVLLCVHVPPSNWVDAAEFEKTISEAGNVKGVFCGHWHRNVTFLMGGVPILVRSANVTAPFSYHMLHLYPDGRVLSVQKSQHFPYEAFLSSQAQAPTALGSEADRYLTLGGTTQLPLDRLKVFGEGAHASINNGHLRLVSQRQKAVVLIDTAGLRNARLTLTAVKASGQRIGGLALAAPDGTGGIEAAVTAVYSPAGKVYLARPGEKPQVLARSWFNITDSVAYQLTLEVKNGKVLADWKNMLKLEAQVDAGSEGRFGFFVDRGVMYVTDLKLERL
jgi:hypothetical protein